MEKEAFFQAAMLWFLVVIYFTMETAIVPPFVEVVDFVGLVLFLVLPIYVLVAVGRMLTTKFPLEVGQDR
ncbi:hypothetical protein ACT4ML_15305 [Natrinema sp. LN54]|uniref:hypothetical protein n=1 Tax=Natrinema sp. LN54 TaxID=3458705 RepID=UPI00403540C7